jgi:ABC-2 type transport system ATP-binding protein
VICTHLLGDVERVCETVVILHRGRIVRQGSVKELCAARQDRYRLQVQGDPRAFRDELVLEGVRVVEDNGRGRWRVAVPAGWVTRAFFALAVNHGVTVHGLARDDETLEELFHRVLAEADGNEGRG